ncbi:MAG: hypothetical protein KDE08_06120 [Rhodobacteraceae bacterium]|nr:hypothetical protein [Paracoccaceae bacterium]
MKNSITIIAAALLSLGVAATAANAANDEMKMVEDTASRLLSELNIDTMKVDDLTVAQLRQIIVIADSKEMGDATRAQVLKIIGQ